MASDNALHQLWLWSHQLQENKNVLNHSVEHVKPCPALARLKTQWSTILSEESHGQDRNVHVLLQGGPPERALNNLVPPIHALTCSHRCLCGSVVDYVVDYMK